MSCGFVIDYASAVSGNVFYYNSDSTCLGIPGYVNGSDCSAWPVTSASASASLVWNPAGGSATTATCPPALFTPDLYPNLVHTIVPCPVATSLFTADGVASYIFPTSGSAMSTFTWNVGPPPSFTQTSDATTPYAVSTYILVSPTVTPSTWTTVVNSTSTVLTTMITTVTTETQTTTVTGPPVTVTARLQKRQACSASAGPAGSYASGASPAALTQIITSYTSTSSWMTTITPTSVSTVNTTISNISNTTSTQLDSTTLVQTTVITIPAGTITLRSSTSITSDIITEITPAPDTTTAAVATGTMGPYAISIVAVGTTITDGLTRRSIPTGRVGQKRQVTEGWLGLADEDGTVGVVESESDAIQFYVINGELVADVLGVDYYTYTEDSIVADPGYETWVLQASPPGAGSISTEWQGLELDTLDWANDKFIGTGLAQMCVGAPLNAGSTINVINFWYDTTLSPPEGACDLVTASILAVEPTPSPSATETFTSQTTITTISTITGPPVTSYVCNNGGMCPMSCSFDTANLATTELCSTDSNGLSTCKPCVSPTPAPIIQTDLAWVTSTVECATPPCQQVVTQLPAPAPQPPCDGDNTVTVYANNGGSGGTVVVAAGAGAANTAAAAPDANTNIATDAATSTPTTTTKSTTRNGTPTASPSIGLAGKVDVRSGSLMALALAAGAFAFLA